MARKLFRVLSLDGGGIRGLIPALVLAALEKKAGRPIAELFDLITGTSTGGILALGLTVAGDKGGPRYTAGDLAKLYLEEGSTIFSRSVWKRISSANGLTDEHYPSTGIESVLERYFGEARLKDALCEVLIPAYEIERRVPFLFRSRYARHPPRPRETFDYPVWQVARSTSAAPTYFEPFRLQAQNGEHYALVDGGVYANNPAMCALVEARSLYPEAEVIVASFGTGELCRPIAHEEAKDWGLLAWARPILDVVFDGVSDTVDFQARQLIGDNYFRFQGMLEEGSDDLDDVSPANLRVLQLHAQRLLAASEERLAALAHRLVPAEGDAPRRA